MGYRLNCLDAPVFMVVPKPMQTEFGIHLGLESCEGVGDLKDIRRNFSIFDEYQTQSA